jgi:predicted translin family RNA/ssDNA-binding protein
MNTTLEELLEVVLSMRSVLQLHDANRDEAIQCASAIRESLETAVRKVGAWE